MYYKRFFGVSVIILFLFSIISCKNTQSKIINDSENYNSDEIEDSAIVRVIPIHKEEDSFAFILTDDYKLFFLSGDINGKARMDPSVTCMKSINSEKSVLLSDKQKEEANRIMSKIAETKADYYGQKKDAVGFRCWFQDGITSCEYGGYTFELVKYFTSIIELDHDTIFSFTAS